MLTLYLHTKKRKRPLSKTDTLVCIGDVTYLLVLVQKKKCVLESVGTFTNLYLRLKKNIATKEKKQYGIPPMENLIRVVSLERLTYRLRLVRRGQLNELVNLNL